MSQIFHPVKNSPLKIHCCRTLCALPTRDQLAIAKFLFLYINREKNQSHVYKGSGVLFIVKFGYSQRRDAGYHRERAVNVNHKCPIRSHLLLNVETKVRTNDILHSHTSKIFCCTLGSSVFFSFQSYCRPSFTYSFSFSITVRLRCPRTHVGRSCAQKTKIQAMSSLFPYV